MGRRFLDLLCLLTGFPGCTDVDFTKKFVEKFIIGKSVPVYDLHNRIFRGNKIMMDMGDPNLIYMTGKIDPHLLFEKTAEIFPVQPEFPCDIFQENRMPVIFFYI